MIVVISCSLNKNSKSKVLANNALKHLEVLGVKSKLIELDKYHLPFCDGDSCYQNSAVTKLQKQLEGIDGAIIATPIYNYDVAATTKNLIELVGSSFANKVVALLCAAGGATSQMSPLGFMNSMMLDFRCFIIPRYVYVTEAAFKDQKLADKKVLSRLKNLVQITNDTSKALKNLLIKDV
jgi:FMN reductase